jgi:hypothetical protein
MRKICDRKILACKGLDLLLWKTIRVMSLEKSDRDWFESVNVEINQLFSKNDINVEEAFFEHHYIRCLLSLKISYLNNYMPPIERLIKEVQQNLKKSEFSISREDCDLTTALSWVLTSSAIRKVDIEKIYQIFLELIATKCITSDAIPQSAYMDFVTTCYLMRTPWASLDYLTLILYLSLETNENYFVAPKKHEIDKPPLLELEQDVLVVMALIEEFNQLAKVCFEANLAMSIKYYESENKEVSNSKNLTVFLHQFQNKSSQRVLCNVLSQTLTSVPLLSKLEDVIATNKYNDESLYSLLHFCVDEYKFNLFQDPNSQKLFRIEKCINYTVSYFVKYLQNLASYNHYSHAIYNKRKEPEYREKVAPSMIGTLKSWQKIDRDKKNKSIAAQLPTITMSLKSTLKDCWKLKMTTKKLYLTYSEMMSEGNVVDTTLLQWQNFEKTAKELNYKWYERQYQINFMPNKII